MNFLSVFVAKICFENNAEDVKNFDNSNITSPILIIAIDHFE